MIAGLYPILDRSFLPDDPAARRALLRLLVQQLGDAGVTILQYRNKQGSDAEVLADAHAMREHAPAGLTLVLNDRVHLFAESGFEGIHVGQDDLAVEQARTIVGPNATLGVSTHTAEQVAEAEATSADYLAVGPVFATRSKLSPDPVIGPEGVRRARALTRKPLVAIGGITLADAPAVREAGADAIAVISALLPEPRPDHQSSVKIAKDFLAVFR